MSYQVTGVPTDDQERRLGELMVDHERAEVFVYRIGYHGLVMMIEFEDGTVVQLNEDGESL